MGNIQVPLPSDSLSNTSTAFVPLLNQAITWSYLFGKKTKPTPKPQQNHGVIESTLNSRAAIKRFEIQQELYTDKDRDKFINTLMEAVKAQKVGKSRSR